MPVKNSYITVTDQFCGAGGSSQGARAAGLEVKLAMNHWKKAIETHQANFPDTDHACTDISACDPRRYPSTHILITSPECTTHSPAGGNTHKALKKQMDMFNSGVVDAATERSRATMWDVCRFAEYHDYNIIIVENVVEAKTRWALFDVWLIAMQKLGYNYKCVFLNSMHCHPTPQSRDRMYVVFWKKGNKAPDLEYMPLSYCAKCECDVNAIQSWKDRRKNYGKYKIQYVYCCPSCSSVIEPYYYAAFNCIDWSDIGERIGDRKKPLVQKTIARIEYGLNKYSKQPLILHTAYGNEARGVVRPLTQQSFTHTSTPSQAMVLPFLIDDKQSTGISFRTRSVSRETNTMHTDPRVKLILPFIYSSSNGGATCSTSNPKKTQTTTDSEGIVIPPIITELRGTGSARSAFRELNGITAGGPHSGILTTESWNSFISYYYGTHQASGANEALGGVNTKDRHQLITYQTPNVDDCYYRMLKPPEVKLAMAFEKDYIVTGSGKDQVKQLGNAVTPPAMEWLVKQCVASLS